jgi:predicted DNA-binding transcriptional regulator AlpA
MLPVSAPTIWRWVKLGTFPKPIRLGPQTTAWPVSDIEDFIAQRSQVR